MAMMTGYEWIEYRTERRRQQDRPDLRLVDPYDVPLPLEERKPVTWPGVHMGREPANKGRRYPIEILTRNEIAALLDSISATSWTGVRNRALVAVMYRTGMRVNEVRHLRGKDIDAAHGMIRVLFGKNQRSRTVGIDRGGLEFVVAWERRRGEKVDATDAPLFCSMTGRLVSSSHIRAMLKTAGSKAGIEKRVHSHGLRHTFAFELAMEGVPLPIIQHQLGHIWASSTAVYLEHIAPAEVVERIRARSWLLPPSVRP